MRELAAVFELSVEELIVVSLTLGSIVAVVFGAALLVKRFDSLPKAARYAVLPLVLLVEFAKTLPFAALVFAVYVALFTMCALLSPRVPIEELDRPEHRPEYPLR